jgi:hypothetical protein
VAVSSGPAHAQRQEHLYNSPGAGFGQGQYGSGSHLVYNPSALKPVELAQPSKPPILGAANGQNRAGSALAQRQPTPFSLKNRDAYLAANDRGRLYRAVDHTYVDPNANPVNPGQFSRQGLAGKQHIDPGCQMGCTYAP